MARCFPMASVPRKADASLPSSAERSSEARHWKYDVFFSFGPGTRKRFISHLSHRLKEGGITTVVDGSDLKVEDDISPPMIKAIEESMIAIVVMSQDYVASPLCLQQLAKICEFMEGGLRILPVFYDVEPADVRKQRGSFDDAFTEYEKSGLYESVKVQQWRDALTKVANLSGWDSRNYMTDLKLIEFIVESAAKIKQQVFEETRQDMDEFIEVHRDEISAVEVYGTGGVDKTTMVKPLGSSSSSAFKWKYDVFLSFRGPDTRRGFTSYLYHRLQERGITAFMDDPDLEVVDDIPPSITKAIEESMIAIVVVSQNYASSTWCLEELTKICQLMKDGLIILPVFYHVNVSDVRHQKGSFDDAFTKHEKSERYELEKVQQWRIALIEVANLSGWDIQKFRTDRDLVESVVEDVCGRVRQSAVRIKKVQPMEIDTGGSEVFEETRQDMDEFMEVHTDDEISSVEFYGTGGVGKTTMVKPLGSSSSSAVKWKYDVFLSFRGPDTRRGFTSYLYHRLQERGITAFMDCPDLEVGDDIPPSITKAIEESMIAIVVVSQNYASSIWCLEELTKICQLMKDGLIILPVFYHVNPSDVRHQKGSFQEAFTKYGKSGLFESLKVQQWRDALTEVANLSGCDIQNFRTEIELIEAIVEFVWCKIYTVGFEVLDATRKALNEVMKALKDEEVTAFGVYGAGGVGKTAMIKYVSAEVENNGMFHHVIKVVVSRSPDLRNIQGKLADMLGLELEEETDIGRSHRLMQKIRRGSRILIILDDIWESIDLSNIGIPGYHELRRCNSKVLLTTRTQNVLRAMECQSNICLDVLSEKDSLTFLMMKASTSPELINYYQVAKEVARECAGLPIALTAVARALGVKDDWEEAGRRFKSSRPLDHEDGMVMFNCIKLSYDRLAYDDARSCFLLCCLFPEDYDIQIEDLLKYGMGMGLFQDSSTVQDARASAHSVVKYLRDCSLLLESQQDGCVKMHDVVRDVAIMISSSEDGQLFFVRAGCQLKEWPSISAPEGYFAISLIRNEIYKLPEELVSSELRILLMQSNVCLDQIPKDFFRGLSKLRVLDLSRTRISLLPTSFSLLINLHSLYLDGCLSIISNISELGKLDKLEILSMRDLPLVELPKELGHLSNLRMLDFTGGYVDIVPSEVICNLHMLEELYMQCNFADWRRGFGRTEVNGSKVDEAGEKDIAAFDELTSLSRLNILKVFISDAKSLPKSLPTDVVGKLNWVSFDIGISRNSSIRTGSLVSNSSPVYTRTLTLGTTINTLPDWFIDVVISKTEKLQYIKCQELDNILVEYDRGRLHALEYLSIIGPSENLNVLMDTVTQVEPVFQNLKELHLVQAECLNELCVGELLPGSLCNLKLLKVKHCYELVDALLPSNLLQRLQSLEVLICEEIDELEYVFGCEGLTPKQIILTELKEMRLENLGKLIKIWKGPAPTIFMNLHSLVVSGCYELKNLFTVDVAKCLLQLEDLSVEQCPSLERVIEVSEFAMDEKIILPRLKNLALIKLPQLRRFYGDTVSAIQCPQLENLCQERCPQFSPSDFNKVHFINHQQYLDIVQRRYVVVSSTSFVYPLLLESL